MNNITDTFIDSAFEKDRSHLPLQPLTPDANLLSKLGSTVSVPHISAATGSNTVLSIGASKFFLAIAGLVAIGALSYVVNTSSVNTGNSGNPMIFVTQDSVKHSKSADTTHKKETVSIEKSMEKNPATINPLDSLIMPQTPARKFQSDSTTVQMHKGN